MEVAALLQKNGGKVHTFPQHTQSASLSSSAHSGSGITGGCHIADWQ